MLATVGDDLESDGPGARTLAEDVTLSVSPSNRWMFCGTHSMASRWSTRPVLSELEAFSAGEAANPKTPTR